MTEPLSDAQVLSALNQLDADLNTILTQRRGLATIKDVMAAYMVAKKTLAEYEATKANLQNSLDNLAATMQDKHAKLLKWFNEEKDNCERQISSLAPKVATARAEAAKLDADLADKEKFGKRRSEELSAEIKSKSAELSSITGDLDTLRKKHGIK